MSIEDEMNEFARTFYTAARDEVNMRLSLQEQLLVCWVATIGVVAGFAIKDAGMQPNALLLFIPALSLPFTILFFRHRLVNRSIGEYLNGHLRKALDRALPSPRVQHWDESNHLTSRLRSFLILDTTVVGVLFCVPAITSVFVVQWPIQSVPQWSAFACGLIATAIHMYELGRVWKRYAEAAVTVAVEVLSVEDGDPVSRTDTVHGSVFPPCRHVQVLVNARDGLWYPQKTVTIRSKAWIAECHFGDSRSTRGSRYRLIAIANSPVISEPAPSLPSGGVKSSAVEVVLHD